MNKIIIGSTAIKHWFIDFNRLPKDIDYAINIKEPQTKHPIEIRDGVKVEYLYNPIIFKYIEDGQYLKPDLLFTLKLSHLFWDINWSKHLWDYHFLQSKGCVLNYKMLDELIGFWTEYLPTVRRSKLELNKEEFFNNSINDDPDQHDKLHYDLISGIRDKPAFTRILKDGKDVEICDDKFRHLSFSEKKDVVLEETIVMSLERYRDSHFLPSYRKQLKDNIIKHFPRSISIFAIDNYKDLVTPSEEFINKIKTIKKSWT